MPTKTAPKLTEAAAFALDVLTNNWGAGGSANLRKEAAERLEAALEGAEDDMHIVLDAERLAEALRPLHPLALWRWLEVHPDNSATIRRGNSDAFAAAIMAELLGEKRYKTLPDSNSDLASEALSETTQDQQ